MFFGIDVFDLLQPHDLSLLEHLHGIIGVVMTEFRQVDPPKSTRAYEKGLISNIKDVVSWATFIMIPTVFHYH